MPAHCEFDVTQRTFYFPRTFVDRPRIAHGLRQLDVANNANIRVSSTFHNLTKSSADCDIITWSDTTLGTAVTSVFAIAPGELDILTGEHMRSVWKDPTAPSSVRIDFERPFQTPPKVVVFLNCIDLERSRNWRLQATASDIDVDGFTLYVGPYLDTIFYAARVGWIAYPEDREHIFSTSVSTLDLCPVDQPQQRHSQEISISLDSVNFHKTPSVFVALNSFDIGCNANFRINAYVKNVSKTSLVWHIDTYADTVLYSAGATIIAFN